MANQKIDVNDLVANSELDCVTAIQHVMSLIFIGTGWTLVQDEKTGRWMMSEGSDRDLVMEDSGDLTSLLSNATVSFHGAIQRTLNEILDLIGFGRKIIKDDSGCWRWIYNDRNLETSSTSNLSPKTLDSRGTEGERERRQLDMHMEGKKRRSEREGKKKTADDSGEGGERGNRKSARHFEDKEKRLERGGKKTTTDRRPSEDDCQAQKECHNVHGTKMFEAGRGEPAHEKEPPDFYSTGYFEGGFPDAEQEDIISERNGESESDGDRQPETEQVESHLEEAKMRSERRETGTTSDRRPSEAQNEWDNFHGTRAEEPAHEKEPPNFYSTGHFQAAAQEDVTNMASPHKGQAAREKTKSVVVRTDMRKRPREVGKVPANKETESQTEARTGGNGKKEFILKSGLEVQEPILLISEMPDWPRLTGGRRHQFNKKITKSEKKWIDGTIHRLHYVTTTLTLTKEQNLADKKIMRRINRLNHHRLNIFIIASLKPGIHLADDIINAYCQLLSVRESTYRNGKSRFYIFSSFFYQQGRKSLDGEASEDDWPKFYVDGSQVGKSSGHFAKRQYLIFPACNGEHHIVLIFNVPKWQLLILDPMNFTTFQEKAAYFVITAVKQILYVRAPKRLKRKQVLCYAPKNIPRQPIGTGDCGVFVAMYVDAFIRGLDLTEMEWEPADILNFRYRLAKDVVMGGGRLKTVKVD